MAKSCEGGEYNSRLQPATALAAATNVATTSVARGWQGWRGEQCDVVGMTVLAVLHTQPVARQPWEPQNAFRAGKEWQIYGSPLLAVPGGV